MDWEIFLGRFHPLMVHLPIGIFILGYFFEVLFQLGFTKLIPSRKIIIVTYIIGLLSGILAAISGWLLSFSNDYGIASLDDHKYLGIATLILMSLVISYQIKAPETKSKLKLLGSTLAILMISVTGHFGGNLTHGSNYLVEYAPGATKNNDELVSENLRGKNQDSLIIYDDFIKPIFQEKCIACHNSTDGMGGLRMETYGDLFEESDHGTAIVARNSAKSNLFNRVSLPADHEKAMPPRGMGFGYTDIQLLKYWINNGADSLATFQSETMDEELINLINRDYGLDFSPKPHYEKVKTDSLDKGLLSLLRGAGFRVNYLSEANYLLDVEFKGSTIGENEIKLLNKVANQITFLKIVSCKLTDDLVKTMPIMEHLTKIDLSQNPINKEVAPYLAKHTHLETANLNETNITLETTQTLLSQATLTKIYLWNTNLSSTKVSNLIQTYPEVEIISQFQFEEVVDAKSVFNKE
ncbi:c-type cytochrome domain-containing protein [Eudoraea sp.]|uniref:c-type cytochrome domain-containing protein n=1 Tax=Eudoraea sp. TaxID=1979955 RepID=UPI003C738D3A